MKATFVERAANALMSRETKKINKLLEKSDNKRLERVIQADRLLLQYRADQNTAKALVKYYAARNEKYSLSSAYRDINDAKRIFGSMRMTHKDYERYMMREMVYGWIKIWETEGGKEMALNAAVKNLISIGRLNEKDEEGIDSSLLGRHPILMTDDVRDIGLERDPRNAAYINSLLDRFYTPEEIVLMKQKYKPDIIDIEFEVIPEDDQKALS